MPSPPEIIVTDYVPEYRATVKKYVQRTDRVLELGCAGGVTTAILAAHCDTVVGADRAAHCIAQARERHAHVRFEVIDADDVGAVLRLGIPFNKIYVDLSGSRPPGVVLACVESYSVVFDLELVVIKNEPLKAFLRQARLWELEAPAPEAPTQASITKKLRREAGTCFACGQPGHMARDCPAPAPAPADGVGSPAPARSDPVPQVPVHRRTHGALVPMPLPAAAHGLFGWALVLSWVLACRATRRPALRSHAVANEWLVLFSSAHMHYDHEAVVAQALGTPVACPYHLMSRPGPRYLTDPSDFALLNAAEDCAERLTDALAASTLVKAVHRQRRYYSDSPRPAVPPEWDVSGPQDLRQSGGEYPRQFGGDDAASAGQSAVPHSGEPGLSGVQHPSGEHGLADARGSRQDAEGPHRNAGQGWRQGEGLGDPQGIGEQLQGWVGHDSEGATRAGPRTLQQSPIDVNARLQTERVWDKYGTRGKGIRVGTFDTGIATRHSHFSHGNIKTCEGYAAATCEDGFGHGTFVAGVIASSQDCVGIAPEAELHVFKVFSDKQVSHTSWFLDALNHALELGLDVVNFSIGGPDYYDLPFVEKVWEASANGVTMVSASGNDGPLFGTQSNPADQEDVVAVGGTGHGSEVAYFSARGMTTWELADGGYGRFKPDLVTIGQNIRGSSHRGGCKGLSGTSVACPVVAGAVTLLHAIAKLHGKPHNPAAIKQVLTSSAQRLPGDAGIFEQGAGELDLVRAAEALMENTPRVTLLPAVLNLTDCPYMWPFCEQPLYATAQPLVLNVTVLNGLGVRGHVVGPPQWRLLSGPDVLDVRVAFADTLWPWTGHLALSVSVREDVPAPADVSGSLTLTVRSQVPPRARKAGAADYVEGSATLPVHVRVVPAPAREKRVLWDQFHNLQYPPGYVPRDNLDRKRDLLDCHGDHLHTNFREVWLRLRSHGYFVEILSEDYTTFDAALYSVLLVVDSEEEFFDEEVSKIAADVRDRGLTLIVFADWYNAEAMRRVEFHDDSTRRWMRPPPARQVTGGANVPALNDLLAPFGIAIGGKVYNGDAPVHDSTIASGNAITQFPVGGYLMSAGLHDAAATSGRWTPTVDLPVLGLLKVPGHEPEGKVVVFTDSNCLDATQGAAFCWDLLRELLHYATESAVSNVHFPEHRLRKQTEDLDNRAQDPPPDRVSEDLLRNYSKVLRVGRNRTHAVLTGRYQAPALSRAQPLVRTVDAKPTPTPRPAPRPTPRPSPEPTPAPAPGAQTSNIELLRTMQWFTVGTMGIVGAACAARMCRRRAATRHRAAARSRDVV